MPDLRPPASVGGAGGRRQYPDAGRSECLRLLAVIALAAEKILSGGLAGERKEPGRGISKSTRAIAPAHPRRIRTEFDDPCPNASSPDRSIQCHSAAGRGTGAAAAAPASIRSHAEFSRICSADARNRRKLLPTPCSPPCRTARSEAMAPANRAAHPAMAATLLACPYDPRDPRHLGGGERAVGMAGVERLQFQRPRGPAFQFPQHHFA